MKKALVVVVAFAVLSTFPASAFISPLILRNQEHLKQNPAVFKNALKNLVCETATLSRKTTATKVGGELGGDSWHASRRQWEKRSPSPALGVNEKDIPAFPLDAPNTEANTIFRWSESEGAEGWALVLPDLEEIGRELQQMRAKCEELSKQVTGMHGTEQGRSIRMQHIQALRREMNLNEKLKAYNPDEHDPKKLGEGGEGQILLGKDLQTGEEVAVKVTSSADAKSSLHEECRVLMDMNGIKGFPRIRHFGKQMLQHQERWVMVMDLLGSSITDLWWATTQGARGFDSPTAIAVVVQMLDLLEQLHLKGWVYRDVKPDNFMMSDKTGRGHLCLVDMGITIKHEKQSNKGSSLESNRFYGTCRYASVNAHKGLDQSFRDDLESLVYVLAFLVKGGLPWEHLRCDREKVREAKEAAVAALTGAALQGEGTPLFPSQGANTPSKQLAHTLADPSNGEPFGCVGKALEQRMVAAIEEMDQDDIFGSKPVSGCVGEESTCHPLVRYMHPECVLSRSLGFNDLPDYKYCRNRMMRVYTTLTGRDSLGSDYEWHSPGQVSAPPQASGSSEYKPMAFDFF